MKGMTDTDEAQTETTPSVRRLDLTSTESGEVAGVAEAILTQNQGRAFTAYVEAVRIAAENLPPRLRRFLVESRVIESEVFLVSGLPLSSDLAPTPAGWVAAEQLGAGLAEELVLLLCGSLVGDPFSWSTQQKGRLVHDVCPSPNAERSLTSASSRAALSLHTEDVHHPCRADYVSLMCLRNPDATATSVVGIDAVTLPPRIRRILREDRFEFHPDHSHAGDELVRSESGPVLFGPSERPYLRFDADFVSGNDKDAADAVRQTAECLDATVEQVVLQPGDMVFLDNYRVVHGRHSFVPRYDGTDRWLKRINLARDIRRTFRKSGSLSRVVG